MGGGVIGFLEITSVGISYHLGYTILVMNVVQNREHFSDIKLLRKIPSGASKILMRLLKIVVVLGFFYYWSYWTSLLTSFRDGSHLYVKDYLFSLPFCIGILVSVAPFRKYIMIPSFILISITSYIHLSTILFGQAWKFSTLGIILNISAIFLFLCNWRILSRDHVR